MMNKANDLVAVDDATYISLCRFYASEARLLDDRRYDEWIELFEETVQYRVQIQRHRDAGLGPEAISVIDDRHDALVARIKQLSVPKLTHAENPPTLSRRFISSIVAHNSRNGDNTVAYASILVSRTKFSGDEAAIYVGSRTDELMRHGSRWSIASRTIVLDTATLNSGLSILL